MPSPELVVRSLVTPSHEGLARDFFLRTLPDDCRAELHRVDGEPVLYGERHWHRVVDKKFDLLERAFDEHAEGDVFVLSDVDIRFYRPFAADVRERIAGLDLLFQDNRPGRPHAVDHLCTGFVVIRSGATVRHLFRRARAVLAALDAPRFGDQRSVIRALAADPGAVRFDLLPPQYWVPYRHGPRWRPGVPLAPPADIVLHHANWTVGNDFKRQQLEAVERTLAERGAAAGVAEESERVPT